MKKTTVFLAVLMLVVGASTAWCGMSETVDGLIEDRMNSDIRLVEDAGLILDLANQGIDKTYHAITDPMEPGLKPIRMVRDETMKVSKKVLNTAWDLLTLKSLRD